MGRPAPVSVYGRSREPFPPARITACVSGSSELPMTESLPAPRSARWVPTPLPPASGEGRGAGAPPRGAGGEDPPGRQLVDDRLDRRVQADSRGVDVQLGMLGRLV